jgi:ABC-type uncharacterized transport system involved in gliding motility auxiliary subunit
VAGHTIVSGGAVRQWARLGLHVALLLAGVVCLQVVAERTSRRADLTATRDLSLAPVSEQVLRELDAPLRLTVFHRRGRRAQHAPLLERMRAVSPHVEFELLDLDRYPERARALGAAQYGTAAVEYHGRRAVVPALPEAALVGGIVRVLRGEEHRVLFTTGHGERAPAGDGQSYGRFVAALASENHRIEPMSLTAGDVPDGAALVVVAGPRNDLLPVEVARLAAYLRRGGAALLLLEPGALPNLADLLGSMGIRIADDFIVDRERSVIGTDGLAAIVELFKRGNPISEPGGAVIESGAVLPSARSVDVTGELPGVSAEAVARTAPSAWVVQGVERARRGETPTVAAEDVPGGAAVMVMAEVGAPGAARAGRLVVVGDADFVSDAYIDLLGNRALGLNAVAWLTEEPMLAGDRPGPSHEIFRPLSPLVLSEAQARSLLLAVAVVQPGLVLVLGALVVAVRRRYG